MVGTNRIKLVKALQNKKNRSEQSLFVVEGKKSVLEVLRSDWQVVSLFATASFLEGYPEYLPKAIQCSTKDLTQMGTYQSNEDALAVVRMKEHKAITYPKEGLHLALDAINDPGNLGTIIRLADWYAVDSVWCSPDTVELFNPKVIAASKGSFLRVNIYYHPLNEVLKNASIPIYGAMMEGENIHKNSYQPPAVLVLGNESKGIDPVLQPLLSKSLHIPSFGGAESLNAAIAAGILLDHLRRGEVGGNRP